MCDTLYFTNSIKRIFMKNSDRSPNEPNLLRFYPRTIHEENTVKCTYIEIPQVKETYACFLVQPSWMFGAEMGVNEYFVSIGNEAVFTKNKDQKTPRLIGMDFLRLALERSKTALDASKIIIDLLLKYGQGGNCGFDHEFYYDNSYLIMDKKETYILETVGKEYCLYKTNGSYNISNKLSLKGEYIQSSKDYHNFEKENSDFLFTFFSMSKKREAHGKALLNYLEPSVLNSMEILSHHRMLNAPKCGDVGSICMHKNMVGDHTTGSLIVDYSFDIPRIYVTGSPSPCISVFKPYYFGTPCDLVKDDINESYQFAVRRMIMNRLVLSNVIDYSSYKHKIDKLNEWIIDEENVLFSDKAPTSKLINFSNECLKVENELFKDYDELINNVLDGSYKLPGMWGKLTKNLSKNPFSNNLEERIK